MTPILSYIWLSYVICHLWHILNIWQKWRNDINHMEDVHMALWVSKEPLWPLVCSHWAWTAQKLVFRVEKQKFAPNWFFLCIFHNFPVSLPPHLHKELSFHIHRNMKGISGRQEKSYCYKKKCVVIQNSNSNNIIFISRFAVIILYKTNCINFFVTCYWFSLWYG